MLTHFGVNNLMAFLVVGSRLLWRWMRGGWWESSVLLVVIAHLRAEQRLDEGCMCVRGVSALCWVHHSSGSCRTIAANVSGWLGWCCISIPLTEKLPKELCVPALCLQEGASPAALPLCEAADSLCPGIHLCRIQL